MTNTYDELSIEELKTRYEANLLPVDDKELIDFLFDKIAMMEQDYIVWYNDKELECIYLQNKLDKIKGIIDND